MIPVTSSHAETVSVCVPDETVTGAFIVLEKMRATSVPSIYAMIEAMPLGLLSVATALMLKLRAVFVGVGELMTTPFGVVFVGAVTVMVLEALVITPLMSHAFTMMVCLPAEMLKKVSRLLLCML